MNMHKVTIKNVTYVRVEDVVEYLRDLAATEETDTRDRLEQAAYNMSQLINRVLP